MFIRRHLPKKVRSQKLLPIILPQRLIRLSIHQLLLQKIMPRYPQRLHHLQQYQTLKRILTRHPRVIQLHQLLITIKRKTQLNLLQHLLPLRMCQLLRQSNLRKKSTQIPLQHAQLIQRLLTMRILQSQNTPLKHIIRQYLLLQQIIPRPMQHHVRIKPKPQKLLYQIHHSTIQYQQMSQ